MTELVVIVYETSHLKSSAQVTNRCVEFALRVLPEIIKRKKANAPKDLSLLFYI